MTELEVDKLRYVEVIARYKSLSKAAEVLHISQPALTRYLNRLEEELGCLLFNRMTIPIQLTVAGEWYIACARQMSDLDENMRRGIREIADQEKGRLRIGMSPARAEHWLSHILPPFHRACPGVDVKFVTGGHSFMEQAVKNGNVDLAFLPLPISLFDLDYEIVATEKMVLVVPEGHAVLEGVLLRDDSLRHPIKLEPERLNGETFLTVPRDHSIYKIMEDILERNGVKPGRFVEYPDSSLTYKLACGNMGLTFVQDTVALYPGYYKKPYFCTIDDIPVKSHIAAAWKRDLALPLFAKRFLDITAEVLNTSSLLRV